MSCGKKKGEWFALDRKRTGGFPKNYWGRDTGGELGAGAQRVDWGRVGTGKKKPATPDLSSGVHKKKSLHGIKKRSSNANEMQK